MKLTRGQKLSWTQALRSGEYSQCRERLTDGVGHCCLGVLADQAGCMDAAGRYRHPYLSPNHYAPVNTLAEDNPPRHRELVKMNDHLGKSFYEIADWIEENL